MRRLSEDPGQQSCTEDERILEFSRFLVGGPGSESQGGFSSLEGECLAGARVAVDLGFFGASKEGPRRIAGRGFLAR